MVYTHKLFFCALFISIFWHGVSFAKKKSDFSIGTDDVRDNVKAPDKDPVFDEAFIYINKLNMSGNTKQIFYCFKSSALKSSQCSPIGPERGLTEQEIDEITNSLALGERGMQIARNGSMVYGAIRGGLKLSSADMLRKKIRRAEMSMVCDTLYAEIATYKKEEGRLVIKSVLDITSVLGIIVGLSGPNPQKFNDLKKAIMQANKNPGKSVSVPYTNEAIPLLKFMGLL